MKTSSDEHLASRVLIPPLCKASYRARSSAGSEFDLNEGRSGNTVNGRLVAVRTTKCTDALY